MKRTKFNSDYCGEILVIGFTGNAKKIQEYLKENFNVKIDKSKCWSKEENFNLEIDDEIVAHIEVYPWSTRNEITIKPRGLKK